MSEIKRCPFCGGDNVGVWHNRPVSPLIADSYEVRCYNCNFGLRPERLKDKAIEAWNTRKPMQNIVERLEEEYHEIDKSKKESYENGDWERFDMFTNLNRGIYKAIAIVNTIVKEEGEINE